MGSEGAERGVFVSQGGAVSAHLLSAAAAAAAAAAGPPVWAGGGTAAPPGRRRQGRWLAERREGLLIQTRLQSDEKTT